MRGESGSTDKLKQTTIKNGGSKMRKKAVYGLSGILVLLFCLYVNPSANAATAEEDVLQVEKNWCKAFKTVDLELISTLYWHSPKTTEYTPNESYEGWEAVETNIKKYFSLGAGVFDWTYFDTQVVMLTDNVAIVSGYHNMFEKPPGGNPYALILRFTHVLQKIDGKWLIIHNNETRVETGPGRDAQIPAS
jgi:ketosteroid isomerase-like protein